ncbi:MAG TPA: hypothetical protein VK348_16000, partial [Planctomycetota bacterium]|nr:hypothetical protein [Planctomycetota bacterium]
PPLCSLMAVQLLLVRWCAGRWLQITFTVLTAAASLGFSLFLMLGVFAQPEAQVERLLRATQDQHAPLARVLQSVAAGAELLGSSLGQPPDLDALRRGLLWLLSTLAAFLLTCRLHPRAVEAYQRAQRPLFARRRSRWPAGIAASLRKKELAQLLQQPAQLIGMLVFGVTVFVLAQQRAFVGGTLATDTLPAPIGQCFSMLSLWFLTVLMVLFAHMGRLAMWDGPQWPLYLKSPAAPGALLRGKLQAIWLLLLWPVLVVSLVGGHELHANLATQLVFAAIALGGNCLAIGVAAAVGTLPLLMRPDVSGQITPGSKSLGAAMLLVFGFELTVAPVLLLWHLLQNHVQHYGLPTASWEPWVPWTVAGVWGYALLVCGLGCWLGARNFARLLRPR